MHDEIMNENNGLEARSESLSQRLESMSEVARCAGGDTPCPF